MEYKGSESYIGVFFFFQAEDGIRDLTVTGVQTCALPILTPSRHSYVVWLEPRGQQPQVMGVLRINGETLEGSVTGTTTEKVFDVVVTAEDRDRKSVV